MKNDSPELMEPALVGSESSENRCPETPRRDVLLGHRTFMKVTIHSNRNRAVAVGE